MPLPVMEGPCQLGEQCLSSSSCFYTLGGKFGLFDISTPMSVSSFFSSKACPRSVDMALLNSRKCCGSLIFLYGSGPVFSSVADK